MLRRRSEMLLGALQVAGHEDTPRRCTRARRDARVELDRTLVVRERESNCFRLRYA
jgi:hypothetical protein